MRPWYVLCSEKKSHSKQSTDAPGRVHRTHGTHTRTLLVDGDLDRAPSASTQSRLRHRAASTVFPSSRLPTASIASPRTTESYSARPSDGLRPTHGRCASLRRLPTTRVPEHAAAPGPARPNRGDEQPARHGLDILGSDADGEQPGPAPRLSSLHTDPQSDGGLCKSFYEQIDRYSK
jgi:hypothetical protein